MGKNCPSVTGHSSRTQGKRETRRGMVREALAEAGGIQTRAAEILGVSERVLRYKLKKYGLSGG